ncbi:MAG: AAA family ATPase [Armatimonadota bacterium]
MRLTEWRVGNFKSIGKTDKYPLAPLTVFVGANSSGKSSFLQSILLVAQTFASRNTNGSLILNGDLVCLGEFDDIIHQDHGDNPLHIGMTTELSHKEIGYISPSFVKSPSKEKIESIIINVDADFQREPNATCEDDMALLLNSDFSSKITYSKNSGLPHSSSGIKITKRSKSDIKKLPSDIQPFLAANIEGRNNRSYNVVLEGHAVEEKQSYLLPTSFNNMKPIGAVFNHFLPSGVLMMINEKADAIDRIVAELFLGEHIPKLSLDANRNPRRLGDRSSLKPNMFEELRSSLRKSIMSKDPDFANILLRNADWRIVAKDINESRRNAIYEWINKTLNNEGNSHYIKYDSLPGDLRQSSDLLMREFTSKMVYLGPLREDPRAMYVLPHGLESNDLGTKGQFTAAILSTHRDRDIRYVPPGKTQPILAKLQDAVSAWLMAFGMVDSVSSHGVPKLGHILTVKDHGLNNPLDLTSVGVGVSQILPVIVAALLADEGSLLIFEQPELHLHPDVQSLLGDFLLSLLPLEKQCIVETHSDYLLNRLRVRVADSKLESDDLLFYFFQRDGIVSNIRQIRVDEYGSIPKWPEGFADQALKESKLLVNLSIKKRMEARK